MSRADKFTQLNKKQEMFSDFLNNFSVSPFNNQLAKTTNENAVRQSVKNLILTNFGERLFQPNIGGNINRSLFGLADEVTASNLVYDIKQTIKINEPRANLIDIKVFPSPDRNSFIIDIIFSVINSQTPIALNLVLRRAR